MTAPSVKHRTLRTGDVSLESSVCHSEILRLRVCGQVQGVGFRPFVHRVATELSLSGAVLNDVGGVAIEARGSSVDLEAFVHRISTDAPPLARIDSITRIASDGDLLRVLPNGAPAAFVILDSDTRTSRPGRITVDSAVCVDCLAEMADPDDRRFGHALINCTNCGPRYSIIRDLPYDRPRTTMASFPMCAVCKAEYQDPANRRFHAQPTCCPECGPGVFLVDRDRNVIDSTDPFAEAARLLADGGVLGMKGLGGFHLAVDATHAAAVRTLRERKHRDHKPFALMVPDIDAARVLGNFDDAATRMLQSTIAPIVIAPRRSPQPGDGPASFDLAEDVAPGQHRLGIMLPNTPMQHLLFAVHAGPLVMTSANMSDDPLVKDDCEALARLANVADAFLTHDRPIERAADDSVMISAGTGIEPLTVRRARGIAPRPVALPVASPSAGLCCGADLKNSVALVRGDAAVLSQHLGDLTHTLTYDRFLATVSDLERLFDVEPEWIAVDLHPEYLSRRYGVKRSRAGGGSGVRIIEVQHHHAHLASLLAEHGRGAPIVGIVCDGVGFGSDGTAWGGEILVGGLAAVERVGHIRPLRLPGGDAAAKQTGRCALSWLADSIGLDVALEHPAAMRVLPVKDERTAIAAMLRADLRCPASSGLGRLFDAAAALLGLCDFNHHEAMSGQLLESAASRSERRPSGADTMTVSSENVIDTRPLARELLTGIERGDSVADLAWFFHDAVADGLACAAVRAGTQRNVSTAGLTGGVFCNLLLTERVASRLEAAGMEVLTHTEIPPNDGGIALGQAAVAAARLAAEV